MLLCMTWWEYVKRQAPSNRTQAAIATSAGVDQTTVSRWRTGAIPSPETVIQTARRFGTEPVAALLAAGYITAAEAHATVSYVVTQELSDAALVDLILKQLKESERRGYDAAATKAAEEASAKLDRLTAGLTGEPE
jgi:transcriptional regulator with XRE-family HTH domain